MNTIHNPNCDGDQCVIETGEVRRYALGDNANAILCAFCWMHENRYRYTRGLETGRPAEWPQEDWTKAPVVI
jgi:hypothetical protein